MTDVRRYAPNPNHDQINAMRDREFGDYVLFDDYQALQAENESLNELLRLATKVTVAGVDINKLKADAVREAYDCAHDKCIERGYFESFPSFILGYANKLEAGE